MTYPVVHGNKRFGFTLQWLASLSLLTCTEPESLLPTDAPDSTVEGTLSKVIVDGHGPNSGAHYFLRLKDSRRIVELTFETPSTEPAGTELEVTGFLSKTLFHVTDYTVLGHAESRSLPAKSPLTNPIVERARTVGIVSVDLNEAGMNVTNDFLYRLILDSNNEGPLMGIGETDKSTRQYYSEVSYGSYRLTGAIEGPFDWNGSACIGGAEDVAVVLRDELSTTYDSYVWYFGSIDKECGYAWGEEGTRNHPAQNSWFNGRFDSTVFAHEMGHNIGLMHASTLSCDNAPFADNPLECRNDEYGNPYSVMGTGGVRHLNAVEKWYLTWLSGCNGVRVRQSGTFTLLPIELPCNGIQALQIPMPKATRTFTTEQSESPTPLKYYYLELRTTRGLDTGMAATVLVHVSDDIQTPDKVCARTALLDMAKATGTFDGMQAGESYTDPSEDVTFRVDSLDYDKAVVTVTMPTTRETTTCLDGSNLVGSGPERCDEPYHVDGTSGASGTSNTSPLDGGATGCDSTTSGGGTQASCSTAVGGSSLVTNGGKSDGLGDADTNAVPATGCGCRSSGPSSSRPPALSWLTATALLVLANKRIRRRLSP